MREQESALVLFKLMVIGIEYSNKISKYMVLYKNYIETRLIINFDKKMYDNYCLKFSATQYNFKIYSKIKKKVNGKN